MMIAQKQGKSRTSNYHIFDMHRGMALTYICTIKRHIATATANVDEC
jgi:hypothetical protein